MLFDIIFNRQRKADKYENLHIYRRREALVHSRESFSVGFIQLSQHSSISNVKVGAQNGISVIGLDG